MRLEESGNGMVLLLFLIAIAIAISPVGRLRLGGERCEAKPEIF